MSWDLRSLDSLLDKSGAERAGKRNFPVLSITMRDGLVDQSQKFKKRVASQDTTKYRIAYRNELVVGFPIDEGVLGFQAKYPAGIVSPAYDIWKLKSPDETYIPYLERYLRSAQARHIYASRMQGAVARRRSLTTADFLGLEIPFPDLDDQKRIAHLLGKVEGLIARRKQHLQQLDDLLKSVFLEMFGDPVRNERGWEQERLRNLCGFITKGTTPKRNDIFDIYDDSLIPFIKVYHICDDGSLNFNFKPSFISRDMHTGYLKRSIVYPNDVLMNIVGPPLGKICIVSDDFAEWNVNQAIAIFRCGVNLNPKYLFHTLKSTNFCNAVINMAVGIRQLNLSLEQCRNIIIPVPPLPIQSQFASIVEKGESIKSRYQQSLTDLETLYGTLSQEAFKGKLDLSRIPLHHELVIEDTVHVVDSVSPTIEVDETEEIEFNLRRFKEIILKKLSPAFSFDDLEEAIDDDDFEFNKIKEYLTESIQGTKPFLKQEFAVPPMKEGETDEKEKQIVFKVNK